MSRSGTLGLAALAAATVAAHAALALLPRPAPQSTPTVPARTCEQELAACRTEAVVRAVARAAPPTSEAPRPKPAVPAVAVARPVPPPVPADAPADPALQQDLLSQIAREHLVRQWEGGRADALSSLRAELADPEKQSREAERMTATLAAALGLDAAATARFRATYLPLRAARIERAHAALAAEPPRWLDAREEARALFAAEDALAFELRGVEGRERLRAAELEAGTVILALLTTWGGGAWDDGLGW